MLKNLALRSELRGLASRRFRADEFKTVRHGLAAQELEKGWQVVAKRRTGVRLRRRKGHAAALEDRVWSLMYRLGFLHLSGQGGAELVTRPGKEGEVSSQLDVVAIDDEVTLVIECKSKQEPGRFADFQRDLGKLVSSREGVARAVQQQLPGPAKRPTLLVFWTSNHILTPNDKSRALAAKVLMLDEGDLAYYEALAAQIGVAARYQFLGVLLAGRSIPGLEITVPAIRSKMGGTEAFTFAIPPEYLLKIAFVSHRARGKASDIDAYQRMLKKGRLRSIRQYIEDGGVFPTNIVVNISDKRWLSFERSKQDENATESTFGWLKLRPCYRVAWIIDGQHRLFAYAGHRRASKALVSVLAFVGLPASEQAQLFVDINAQQKKVKQSLLQELFAELHWEAEDPRVRTQAILSKVVQGLDRELDSPFLGRILKADDPRSEKRCISLTSVFKALERAPFLIARIRKGGVVDFGPFWVENNETTRERTATVLKDYFESIRVEAGQRWEVGSGEGGGLAMNDGITVCINVLRSVLGHLEGKKRLDLHEMSTDELARVVQPYGRRVGQFFHDLTEEQMSSFRALRGVQGQTTGTRRVEQALRAHEDSFEPQGLGEFLERERAQTTTRAFEVITRIEKILQELVIGELKREHGQEVSEWFFGGVPKQVRAKVLDRINEEGGKGGGEEENFDLIDYRTVILQSWHLFESLFARGKGSKDLRTKWLQEVNDLRKIVMHASKGQHLPITEEQLSKLEEVREWLENATRDVESE